MVLLKHNLNFIHTLVVDDKLLEAKFATSCSMAHCRGDCCRYGVWVDVRHRDLILEHKDLILRHLEPQQEHDPDRWFEKYEIEEPDFPSGRAVGTQERDTGCVFLDSHGRCVLQSAATAEGMDKFSLKPFFCVTYPVTIEDHILTIDDEEFPGNTQCCSAATNGVKTVLDVCDQELEFALGKRGFEEFKELFVQSNH